MNSSTAAAPLVFCLLLTPLTTVLAAPPTPGDPDESVLAQARTLIAAGEFNQATALLQPLLPDSDSPVTTEAQRLVEQMRRIRLDYSLDEAAMLAKLDAALTQSSRSQLARWRESGDVQFRVIDGNTRYFNRAVGVLVRFNEEAKSLRRISPDPSGEFSSADLAAYLLDRAKNATSPDIFPVRYQVTYTLTVNEDHPGLKPGAKVRCWLPFPQAYRAQQRDVVLLSSEPEVTRISSEDAPQRTLYFEKTLEDATAPSFSATFEFTTSAWCPNLDPDRVQPYDTASDLYRTYAAERLPHIAFTPRVQAIVSQIVDEESNPLIKAQRLFAWVSHNVPWCPEMEYSTIPSLSQKGIEAGRGDCGVQGMTFITLCRAAGIPARWQTGWQLKPDSWNMHDWSEIYIEPWGWLPADASNGILNHPDPQVQMFYCGHMDPYRLIVNLDYARELEPAKTSWRSEPNDFQRGEIEIDGRNLYFDEWDWSLRYTATPLEPGFRSLQETLDKVVPEMMRKESIPGSVIAAGRKTPDGFETWEKAYGYISLEPRKVPMPADAIFDMASLTKPLATGTSLLHLVEAGKVELDAPVSRYIPEYATGERQKVTVRHLVTHTSGLPSYLSQKQRKELAEANGNPCRRALRDLVRSLEPIREPGTMVSYSCLNAIMSAEIVEAVSGEPLEVYARKNIYEPLGMTETGYLPPASKRERCIPTTRTPYGAGEGGFLRGQVHDPLAAMQAGVSGNAGLFTTASDLARFAQMMLNGGELDGQRILSPESIELASTVLDPGVPGKSGNPDRRGFLWDIYAADPETPGAEALNAYGHTGYTGVALRIYPEKGVYVMALTNRVHPDDSGHVGGLRQAVWNAAIQTLMDPKPDAE